MSQYFQPRRFIGTHAIPLDPNFKCPACDQHEAGVVLFCSRCWRLLPPTDQADLRRMTIAKQDTKTKTAKCVRIIREKLKLS